jgi:RHS repeat-associated protein
MILRDTEYNSAGQLYRISAPYFAGDGVVWEETFSYDEYLRPYTVTRNTGRNTSFSYSGATVSETTAGKTTSKTMGPDGTLSAATDNGGTINYSYYPDGKVKNITAPGSIITSMQYGDAARNQTQLTDPSAGTTSYTYNSRGQLKTQTDAQRRVTTYNYYDDGRINTIVSPEGTTSYTYNSPNKQLTGISTPDNVTYSYGYDSNGRITSIGDNIAGSAFSTTLTYDSYGRLSTRTHNPTGITETINYNAQGYMSSISAGGATRYTITAMNAREQLTAATYGSSLNASYGFDSYGYPSSTQTGTIQDYRYTFAANTGNLSSRQNYLRSKSESFGYDDLDRLTSVTGPQNLSITYGSNGNISTKSDIGTTAFEYGSGTGPYALTGVTSSSGVIPAVPQTADYNSFQKISYLEENGNIASFLYSADKQRAKMVITANGTAKLTRWYFGNSCVKETSPGVSRDYVWIGGDSYSAPVVAVTESGATSYFYLLRDHLGNITHQVNTSNTVVAEYSFDAWGRRRNPLDWSYNVSNEPELLAGRGFTGHEFLKEFNIYNMNGRLYDPTVGRFLSPDIVVQAPDYTQSYNRYTYCLNNPLKFADPSGYILPIKTGIPYDYNDWWKELDGFSHSSGGGGGGWFEAYKSAISNGYLGGVDNFVNQYNNQTSSSDFNGTITVRYQTGSAVYEVEDKWYGMSENGRLFVASTTAPAVTPVYSTLKINVGGGDRSGVAVSVLNGAAAYGVGGMFDIGAVYQSDGDARFYITLGLTVGLGKTIGTGISRLNKGFTLSEFAGYSTGNSFMVPLKVFGSKPLSGEIFGDWIYGKNLYPGQNMWGIGLNVGFGGGGFHYWSYTFFLPKAPVPPADFWYQHIKR